MVTSQNQLSQNQSPLCLKPESLRSLAITLEKIKGNRYIPHVPTAKQLAFLLLDDFEEAFYGGAAGGGKSDALLMAALMYVDIPDYAAIIFRKTYQDLALPGAIMDRAKDWLINTDAKWSDQEKTWHFPSGATLTFGYLDNENDHYRYQSAEFQFCGFDELTQHQENQYRYLFSRLRRLKTSSVPIRMRSASNPGGSGHDWVKQRFITEGMKSGRPFIPATLRDNPFLDEIEYTKSLLKIDATNIEYLKNGNWDARPAGTKFNREWFEIVAAFPNDCQKVRRWDMAATEAKKGKDPDWTVGALVGISQSTKTIYIIDIKRMRGAPLATEQLVKQTAEIDGRAIPVTMEQEPGSAGVKAIDDYRRRVLMGWNFQGFPSTGSKEVYANSLSSQAQAGNVKLVSGAWIGEFLNEAESFPNGSHDDQVDATSKAFFDLTKEEETNEIIIYDALADIESEMRL